MPPATDARARIDELVDELNDHSYRYHALDAPIIDDTAYDNLFRELEVLLTREGDYVLWEPGEPHYWVAEEDTLIFTVRWPSLPGDSLPWDGDIPHKHEPGR